MKHIIIGTAGHIDHGKTALIKALTGRNTDRWKEEQQRGITIDLGFTWFDLKNGVRAGIVDVPGHEKFINHMVAGVVGMDLVLLVIAADEGVMPQTQEHMAILQLLGVEKCIIVVNKCDLVEDDWLELMVEDIRERLKETVYHASPIIPVSSVTGQGLSALEDEIIRMMSSEIAVRDCRTIPRLPVDRSFSISGHGTVVTGTLISGHIAKDDLLWVYPKNEPCRIRGIQVHGQDVAHCEAGQRVALNIANLKKDEIRRGAVIAPAQSMKNTRLLDVRMTILPDSERTLTHQSRLHFYSGTSEVLCRAVLLDKEEIGPGEAGLVQLRLEQDVALKRGDHFVVRFYSPAVTIGGGVILEANPRKKKRFDPQAIEELHRIERGSLADVLENHVRSHGDTMLTLQEAARLMACREEELVPYVHLLTEQGVLLCFETRKDLYLWHSEQACLCRMAICQDLMAYYEACPYRYGKKMSELHTAHLKKVKVNVWNLFIEQLIDQGYLERENDLVALGGHEAPKDATYTYVLDTAQAAFMAAGYDFVQLDAIDFGQVPRDTVTDIMKLLCDQGIIVELVPKLYTMTAIMTEVLVKLETYFSQKDTVITITYLRDLLDTSRKNVKIIFDYTDRLKITRKSGGESEREKY